MGDHDGNVELTADAKGFFQRFHDAIGFIAHVRDIHSRKQFGWSLVQLAELSGVSITTISRAEPGQLALGYENFAALGRALRMDLGEMVAAAGKTTAPMSGPIVTRSGDGITYPGLSFSYEFLGTSFAGKQMVSNLGTVHARRINGPEDFARHVGEEFVYVLSGALEVHFDPADKVEMAPGDSIYFDSRIGPAYITVSRQLARIIGVVPTESTQMLAAKEGERSAPRIAAHRVSAGPRARTKAPAPPKSSARPRSKA